MTNEIQQEMEKNLEIMEDLIEKQVFSVRDAHRFLARYYNAVRKVEQLEISRDKWKAKYIKIKEKVGI